MGNCCSENYDPINRGEEGWTQAPSKKGSSKESVPLVYGNLTIILYYGSMGNLRDRGVSGAHMILTRELGKGQKRKGENILQLDDNFSELNIQEKVIIWTSEEGFLKSQQSAKTLALSTSGAVGMGKQIFNAGAPSVAAFVDPILDALLPQFQTHGDQYPVLLCPWLKCENESEHGVIMNHFIAKLQGYASVGNTYFPYPITIKISALGPNAACGEKIVENPPEAIEPVN